MKIDREGSVLVLVLVVFMVLSILTMSIIYVFSTNTRQIVTQKDNMLAYYLAQSGVEIGYAAIQQKTVPVFFVDSNTVSLKYEIDLSTKAGGKIKSITMKKIKIDGFDWIDISSVAIHNETNTTGVANMKYPLDNPSFRNWYK